MADTIKRAETLEAGDRCHGPIPFGDHGIVRSVQRMSNGQVRIHYEGGTRVNRPDDYEFFIEAPMHAPGHWS